MVWLVTGWIAASRKLGNLHTCRSLRKFVRLFPRRDLRSLKPQLFMTEHMKFEPMRAVHLLHPSIDVYRIWTRDGHAGIGRFRFPRNEVDGYRSFAARPFDHRNITRCDDGYTSAVVL